MPEFPIYPTILLLAIETKTEPAPTTTEVDSENEETHANIGQATKGTKKSTFIDPGKDKKEVKEGQNNPTTTTTPTTTKGKTPIPPSPPASVTAQDCVIDQLIDDITETDKEGKDVNPLKGRCGTVVEEGSMVVAEAAAQKAG
ncbi:hypothetical protein J1N35_011291 [Gossypium stocksii]|uniref:Uncharacterized protein n=1 Tax=Gossypium stocksii TaxID=47602 RepID=A0A9D3W3Y9_9ROSI|nr:hypothetical protein J1N35_011291 [Gossypium stocksii]